MPVFFMTPILIAWLVLVFGGGAAAAGQQLVSLRRIERKLDAWLNQQGVSLPPQARISEGVQRLARDPVHKKEAIMLHQAETGLGFAEARSEVEDFIKTIVRS